jgi:hypothetical protein
MPGVARASLFAEQWLRKWGDRLTYQSEQKGCGCCVLHWDVEGPAEAIAEIPDAMRAYTDWAPNVFTGKRHHNR